MNHTKITVEASIAANLHKTWTYYTTPEHITKWNFADSSWHCPSARNDLKVGGLYSVRMEAKDGSVGFDFDAVYTNVVPHKTFTYEFGGRLATVAFIENTESTTVTVSFDPENENSLELQRAGWQAILNNFKTYTESH